MPKARASQQAKFPEIRKFLMKKWKEIDKQLEELQS